MPVPTKMGGFLEEEKNTEGEFMDKFTSYCPEKGEGRGTVGQNRQKGEVSISHVTSSILDIILSICVARNVRNRSEHISKLV